MSIRKTTKLRILAILLTSLTVFTGSAQDVLSGNIFLDHNSDGIKNFLDYDHPIIQVKLYDDTDNSKAVSAGDLLLDSTTTDVNGDYSFTFNLGTTSITREIPIKENTDDAEQNGNTGFMVLYSSDIELTEEVPGNFQKIGLRFQDVGIPQGATVNSAYLRLLNQHGTEIVRLLS